MMAFRSTINSWRKMVNGFRGSATYATATHAPTAAQFGDRTWAGVGAKGEFVPVYVAMGMIMLSTMLGLHSAKQHLLYSPGVYVRKSRRETLPEVYEPDHVVDEAQKLITKSFFRKVAHVQELDHHELLRDPIRGDVFARKLHAETLKDVGVDPKAPS